MALSPCTCRHGPSCGVSSAAAVRAGPRNSAVLRAAQPVEAPLEVLGGRPVHALEHVDLLVELPHSRPELGEAPYEVAHDVVGPAELDVHRLALPRDAPLAVPAARLE